MLEKQPTVYLNELCQHWHESQAAVLPFALGTAKESRSLKPMQSGLRRARGRQAASWNLCWQEQIGALAHAHDAHGQHRWSADWLQKTQKTIKYLRKQGECSQSAIIKLSAATCSHNGGQCKSQQIKKFGMFEIGLHWALTFFPAPPLT